MAYFLIGNHGALCMAGDPGAPELPVAIIDDENVYVIDLVIGDEPEAGVELVIELEAPAPEPSGENPEEAPRGVAIIDVLGEVADG